MSKPTLFTPGSLVAQKDGEDTQEMLDKLVPIDYIERWFNDKLYKNSSPLDRILLVEASTGSGKTTVIPPRIYKFKSILGRNIACTQPRIINAVQIPYTIAEFNPELIMGDTIGYQTGNLVKKPSKGIIFMTVGLLLQQLNVMEDADFINKYSTIIIDEAHELSIGTELVLMLMRNLINRNYTNQRCPFLVIMSATFNPKRFYDYLTGGKDKGTKNIIKVRGFTFPITDSYLKYDTADYISSAAEKAIELHKKIEDFADDNNFRDILIFVSGAKEIKDIASKVEKMLMDIKEYNDKYPLLIIALTGDVVKAQTKEYDNIFAKYGKTFKRRLVIGTNVAETGITIDTLKYVIDTGYHKSSEFMPTINASVLYFKPISNDMRTQRRGRVGRKSLGEYYGLYTEETVNSMVSESIPEIYKTDISQEVIILNGIEKNNDLLSGLPPQLLSATYEKLFMLGMIDGFGKNTELADVAKMYRFIPIESIKMILSGLAWNVNILDLIDIASIIEFTPLNYRRNIDQQRKTVYEIISINEKHSSAYYSLKHSCDFVMHLLLFRKCQENVNDIHKFLSKLGMETNEKNILEALKLRDDLIYTTRMLGIDIYSGKKYTINQDPERVKRCIYEGYRLNTTWKATNYFKVTIPELEGVNKPTYTIYKKLKFMQAPDMTYTPLAEIISVFDGVPIDY